MLRRIIIELLVILVILQGLIQEIFEIWAAFLFDFRLCACIHRRPVNEQMLSYESFNINR